MYFWTFICLIRRLKVLRQVKIAELTYVEILRKWWMHLLGSTWRSAVVSCLYKSREFSKIMGLKMYISESSVKRWLWVIKMRVTITEEESKAWAMEKRKIQQKRSRKISQWERRKSVSERQMREIVYGEGNANCIKQYWEIK